MDDLPTPTTREMEILKVLWTLGRPASAMCTMPCASKWDDTLAYNTVQTLLRIMETKQLVGHHVVGRTFIYSPRFSREEKCRPISRSRV